MFSSYVIVLDVSFFMSNPSPFRLYQAFMRLFGTFSTLVTRSPSATICFHLPLNQSGYHPHLFGYIPVLL